MCKNFQNPKPVASIKITIIRFTYTFPGLEKNGRALIRDHLACGSMITKRHLFL
jgi:hypothetical protein